MTKSGSSAQAILTNLWERVFARDQPSTEADPNRFPLSVSPDTRVSQQPEGLTLFHIPTGQIFVCNRTAARIWEGAAEGRSAEELSEELSRQFRIGREVAQRDTYLLVRQMEKHGLIRRASL